MQTLKRLVLFTNAFPTSLSLENYLIAESSHLSAAFEKVLIVPHDKDSVKHPMNANCEVDFFRSGPSLSIPDKLKLLFNYLPWIRSEFKNKHYQLKDLADLIREIFIARAYADGILGLIKKHRLDPKETLFYTYWCNTITLALAMLQKDKVEIHAVSRAHQGDVYFNANQKTKTSFYPQKLNMLKKLFVISEHGQQYLQKKYKDFEHKIEIAYLGVENPDTNQLVPGDVFTIVSVSKFGDNKRVFEIPKILKLNAQNVRWVHFGWGGPKDHEKVQRAIDELPPNTEVKMMGLVSNEQILQYYKENPVNLFINISVVEGLSFAAIEALSFGIPLLLTHTNAAAELIDGNGLLVPVNFKSSEVAKYIKTFAGSDQTEARKNSRVLFLKRFDASKNYPEFIQRSKLYT